MRLDQALKAQGFFSSREKAQAAIKAGDVKLDGTPVLKPAFPYHGETITTTGNPPYVSRSAEKLKGALEAFGMRFEGDVICDIGASTGGFTQVALEYGAQHVIAIDVGRDQLDQALRKHPQVRVLEETHFLHLTELAPIDWALIDVSFISSLKILRHLLTLTTFKGVLVLFKPQFEANRKLKSPIIKAPKEYARIQSQYEETLQALGYTIQHIFTPIKGKLGNQELLYYLTV